MCERIQSVPGIFHGESEGTDCQLKGMVMKVGVGG